MPGGDRDDDEHDAPAAPHAELSVAQRSPALALPLDEHVGLASWQARELPLARADDVPDRLVVERLHELLALLRAGLVVETIGRLRLAHGRLRLRCGPGLRGADIGLRGRSTLRLRIRAGPSGGGKTTAGDADARRPDDARTHGIPLSLSSSACTRSAPGCASGWRSPTPDGCP